MAKVKSCFSDILFNNNNPETFMSWNGFVGRFFPPHHCASLISKGHHCLTLSRKNTTFDNLPVPLMTKFGPLNVYHHHISGLLLEQAGLKYDRKCSLQKKEKKQGLPLAGIQGGAN